jgi:hypothetical protein
MLSDSITDSSWSLLLRRTNAVLHAGLDGGVPTTGLTLPRNYTHDNVGAQGLPFLKDGDISNVTIPDNLSLHNTNTNGQVTEI